MIESICSSASCDEDMFVITQDCERREADESHNFTIRDRHGDSRGNTSSKVSPSAKLHIKIYLHRVNNALGNWHFLASGKSVRSLTGEFFRRDPRIRPRRNPRLNSARHRSRLGTCPQFADRTQITSYRRRTVGPVRRNEFPCIWLTKLDRGEASNPALSLMQLVFCA